MKNENIDNLVSIIMPTYNCAEYIIESIYSVVNQTYTNWELIIVDDSSSDNTEELINEHFYSEKRIKYCRLEKNMGAAVARNTAIGIAHGEYIAFLDSDDLWDCSKLQKQIDFMKIHNSYFSCTSYDKIDDESKKINRVINVKFKSGYYDLLKTCPGNSTVIYNAKELGKFYIPSIRKRNDYVMWLEVIKKATVLNGLNETLGSHRLRKNAISSNKLSLVKYHWIVYRDIEKLGVAHSIYLIVYWIIATVFKLR